jgi:hypothetical protein
VAKKNNRRAATPLRFIAFPFRSKDPPIIVLLIQRPR